MGPAHCNELPTIWQQLHQQSDQKGQDIIIRKFFQKLGKKCPNLEQFHSSTLFDHIINHKFLPRESYDMCHHGLSILAISLCSFTVQELKQCKDDIFQWASNITPDALWKHQTKGPPALPHSIGNLLQLFDRLIMLTKGLFTPLSSMASQLRALQLAL